MLNRFHFLFTIALLGLLESSAAAQATTVQLPSFSYFTVNTSVLVPDGGSAFLGGVSRSSEGSISRGVPGLPGPLFNNVGRSQTSSASGARVTATIHDFEAIDDALLNTLVVGQTVTNQAQRFAAEKAPAVGGRAVVQSVADIQRQQAAEQLSKEDEARQYVQQGDAALANHKPGVAKIYYQMAARRSSGQFLADVQTKIRSLSTPSLQVASQPGSTK